MTRQNYIIRESMKTGLKPHFLTYSITFLFTLCLSGCNPAMPSLPSFSSQPTGQQPMGQQQPEMSKSQISDTAYLTGKVEVSNSGIAAVRTDSIDLENTGGNEFQYLADLIAQRTMLIQGIDTRVAGKQAVVEDIRGSSITFRFKESNSLRKGKKVDIFIPRKTLAVSDFTETMAEDGNSSRSGYQPETNLVLGGKSKIFVDNLTSALVETNHFNVVERDKLETVLKEQKLGASGLINDSTRVELGKLLQADLILTGSLGKMANGLAINIKLINVQTGHIISAISHRMTPPDQRQGGNNRSGGYQQGRNYDPRYNSQQQSGGYNYGGPPPRRR